MKLTKRDIEILHFINAAGYCTAPQIGKRFSLGWWLVYRLMKRLAKTGLIVHKRIYIEQHGIFYLTPEGAKYTDLPPLNKISKGIYDHQLILVDVILKLRERYPEAKWTSERHLKQQKFFYGLGKLGHVADGILSFADNTKVAIELELSLKSKRRLEKIFRGYGSQIDIGEAWYFCTDNIISPISALSAKRPFIKIFSLKEFLHV